MIADVRRGYARLAAPAASPLVRGAGVAQPAPASRPLVRVPLPARVAYAAFQLCSFTQRRDTRRDAAVVVFGFLFMSRASTIVAVRVDALSVVDGVLRFREDVRKLGRRPRFLDVPLEGDAACAPAVLLASFWRERARVARPAEPLFDLPSASSASAAVSGALDRVLAALGLRPPRDTFFAAHSLRSGGATAALAAGASLPVVMWWGGWSSLSSVQRYLDPLVLVTRHHAVFFAHLRR